MLVQTVFLKKKYDSALASRKSRKDQAFGLLDAAMQDNFDHERPTARTDALLWAARNADTRVDWVTISTHVSSDPRLFGKATGQGFQRFFFWNCDMEVMKPLVDVFIERMFLSLEKDGMDKKVVASIHLSFTGLLAVYGREPTERNRDKINQFMVVVEVVANEKKIGQYALSNDLTVRFKAFRHGQLDPPQFVTEGKFA